MKHLRFALVVAIGTAVSLGGTAAASGFSGTTPGTPKGNNVSEQVSDQVIAKSGHSLEKVRKLIPAGNYGGAYLDKNTGHVKVMVTKPTSSPVLDPRTDAPVDFVIVQHSMQDLERQKDAIFGARASLATKGVTILRVDGNEVENTVDVAVEGPVSAKARAAIAAIVPGAPLVVTSAVKQGEIPAVSRVDDLAPWSAGSFIYNPTMGWGCTSGPGVSVGNYHYMLTAAHCGTATGQMIQQGHPSIPGTLKNVGPIKNRSGYPNLDAMLVGPASNNANLFRSWYNTFSASSVPWESMTGETVCTGGAISGEKCNLKVGTTNFCSATNCGLTGATGTSTAVGQGDSGGPVYILAPGLRYSGIITSIPDNATYSCPSYPSGTRLCSKTVYFTRMQNILAYFAAGLL